MIPINFVRRSLPNRALESRCPDPSVTIQSLPITVAVNKIYLSRTIGSARYSFRISSVPVHGSFAANSSSCPSAHHASTCHHKVKQTLVKPTRKPSTPSFDVARPRHRVARHSQGELYSDASRSRLNKLPFAATKGNHTAAGVGLRAFLFYPPVSRNNVPRRASDESDSPLYRKNTRERRAERSSGFTESKQAGW